MNRKAFTLIELLVVIAIIGILSGFIVVSMSGATNAAKDAKRKANIDTLRKALILYNFQTGSYPTESTQCNIGSNCSALATALVPTYLAALPTDPNSGSYYTYVSATGADFTVGSTLSSSTLYTYTASTGFSGGSVGSCGPADGHYRSSIPTGTDLCSTGTASAVSGSGPWAWDCSGTSCATVDGIYTVASFSTAGSTTWTAPAGITSIDYLIVGGGGGGGAGDGCAGGGGGGGVRTATGYTVVPGTVYNIVVGAGGAGGAAQRTSGSAGGLSSFNGIQAAGGGYGAAGYVSIVGGNGGTGGGGGATWGGGGGAGGSGNTPSTNPVQGYNGGAAGYYAGGGGGGAGVAGSPAAGNANSSAGGAGGAGVVSSISGSSVTYGGGGGGAGGYVDPGTGGAGGAGGGGAGATSNMGIAVAGTDGLGGGGGGSSNGYTPYVGKKGGSGIVIIRYATNY